ncbi:MAG: hypothetical protein AB9917_23845 [Negativicutes bacterium]
MGLKPWEFGRLTFGEFYELAEGYHWRTQQEQKMTAGFVASIINTCTSRDLKKPVTVDMLLGSDPVQSQEKTKDQAKAEMKALLAEVG